MKAGRGSASVVCVPQRHQERRPLLFFESMKTYMINCNTLCSLVLVCIPQKLKYVRPSEGTVSISQGIVKAIRGTGNVNYHVAVGEGSSNLEVL